MSNAFDLMFVRTQNLPTFVDHRKNSSIRRSLKPNTIFVINPELNSSLDMALGVILTIQNITLVLQERRCKPSKKAKIRHCAISEGMDSGCWPVLIAYNSRLVIFNYYCFDSNVCNSIFLTHMLFISYHYYLINNKSY
jgi:hypothetical protein